MNRIWTLVAILVFVCVATTAAAEPVAPFRAHAGRVNSLNVSPDGKRLVTAGEDATTRVWKVGDNQPQHILSGKMAEVSPDWKRLVTSGSDGLRLWDLDTGEPLVHSKDVTVYCTGISWSPDGKTIAVCPRTGTEDTIFVLDAKTLAKKLTINTHVTQQLTCQFSPDGRILAAGGGPYSQPRKGEVLSLWDAESGESLGHARTRSGRITDIEFSPDGSLIATASRFRSVEIWKVPDFFEQGKQKDETAEAFRQRIKDLIQELNDDQFAVREDAEKQLRELGRSPLPELKSALKQAPNAETRVRMQKLVENMPAAPAQAMEFAGNFEHPEDDLADVEFSPTGKQFATIDASGKVVVWDWETKSRIGQDNLETRACGPLRFTPDENHLLVAPGGEVRRLELSSMERRHALARFGNLRVRMEKDQAGAVVLLDFTAADDVTDNDLRLLRNFPVLKSIYFGFKNSKVTDNGLENLRTLKELQTVSVGHTKASDRLLGGLGSLEQLRELYLAQTAVTDQGLAKLKELEELRVLVLTGTSISDKGLTHLRGLKGLTTLHLVGTEVTEAGAKQLQEALPDAKILH